MYDWCQVVPFPLFEFQSKWIAGLLSNRLALPHKEQMMEDVEAFYSILESSGIPKRYTHNMADYQVNSDSLDCPFMVENVFKFCLPFVLLPLKMMCLKLIFNR